MPGQIPQELSGSSTSPISPQAPPMGGHQALNPTNNCLSFICALSHAVPPPGNSDTFCLPSPTHYDSTALQAKLKVISLMVPWMMELFTCRVSTVFQKPLSAREVHS